MMRKQLSFATALRQFFRQEEGVAFITFGIFVALLGILLLAANIDYGRNYGSQTEIRSKLEEYSVPLTEDFNELWFKAAQCRNNPDADACKENADKKQRVFMNPLNTYFDAGGIKKSAIEADMIEYIKRAFNEDLGKLRFQLIEPPVVTIGCNDKFSPRRHYLTFQAKAPQFDTFFKGGSGKNIAIEVERLTKVPCDMDELPNNGTPSSYIPAPGAEMCTHAVKPRKGSEIAESTEFTNPKLGANVNGNSLVSVVNFVMPLDANSNRDMGGTNAYTSRFANSVRNLVFTLGSQDKIAAGLAMGNYPMEGGGAPKCSDNGSSLPGSGSCFDDSSKLTLITAKAPGSAGLKNISRKDALNGEFRAQYTRRCAPEDAVWTYETVDRGSCYERTYEGDAANQKNAHTWFFVPAGASNSDIATIGNMGNYYDYGTALAACQRDFGSNAESVWGEPWVHPSEETGKEATAAQCAAAGYGSGCKRVSIAVHCIVKSQQDYRVFSGKWTPACRSVELGNDPNRTYTPPSQLVSFNAELVADLEGKTSTVPTTPKITLGATLAQALTPTSMRSVDARRLNQIDELHPLNVKNTERSFNWACDSGPVDTATGKHANNSGNLSTPYGERVDSSKALLEYDAVTQTSLARNANDGSGCSVPSLPYNSYGQMESTIATYDLRFTRINCPNEPCDVPEGMYAISMKPGRQLQSTSQLPTASKFPQGGLTTTWAPEQAARDPNQQSGRALWAWDDDASTIATVAASDLGNECPKVGGAAAPCPGAVVRGNDGKDYCTKPQYNDTFYNSRSVCGVNGENCPNIAKYILKGPNATENWPAISAEKLNISSIGLERRQKPDTSGQAIPYMCTLDKGETTTSQRGGRVAIAGGTYDNDPQCNWRNGDPFFCSTRSNGSPTSAEQVEQFFIDSANAGGGGGQGLGIFALNANNFTGSTTIPIGDDMEEWRTDGLSTNFKTRNLTKTGEIKSTYDTGLGIMPVQIENEEIVRYKGSDLPPDNMEIRNDGNQLDRVLTEVARGYNSFEILNHHTGNQCALIKTGLRQLWNDVDSMAGHTTSKFLVYIGSLPNKDDITEEQAKHLANSSSGSSGAPGLYDSTQLKLKGKPTLSTSFDGKDVDPAALILEKCIGSADEDASTTPFIVTTLPKDAKSKDVDAILTAMREATANTTNESCKRPFCLLSDKDGEFGDGKFKGPSSEGQNIMTPETCAAKLWKCISPATTKF